MTLFGVDASRLEEEGLERCRSTALQSATPPRTTTGFDGNRLNQITTITPL